MRDDVWTGEPVDGTSVKPPTVPLGRLLFYDDLIAAIGRAGTAPGETTLAAWEAECERRGRIERDGPGRKANFRRAKSELLSARYIAIDGERVIDLKGRWK